MNEILDSIEFKNLDELLLNCQTELIELGDICSDVPIEPDPGLGKRIKGCFYTRKGKKMYWNGKQWLCEHKVTKTRCKQCGGGSGFCKHDKRIENCSICGKKYFCIHGRRKHSCIKCGGTSICHHGRRRQNCRECGGASICVHGTQKYNCVKCNGSGVCEHGKKKHNCHICIPFYRSREYQKYKKNEL